MLGSIDQTQKGHSEAVGLPGSRGGVGGWNGLQLAETPPELPCLEGTAVVLGLSGIKTLLTVGG